jgi:hypothetical protein
MWGLFVDNVSKFNHSSNRQLAKQASRVLSNLAFQTL